MPGDKSLLAEFTILGNLPSMKNRRDIVYGRAKVTYEMVAGKLNAVQKPGKPISIKSTECGAYASGFVLQVPGKYKKSYRGPVVIDLTIFYKNPQSDLDQSFFQDCLQYASVIENDNQIIGYVRLFKYVDKVNPRVECKIYRAEKQMDS